MKHLYTIPVVADLLSIPVEAVCRIIESNRIETVIFEGRRRLEATTVQSLVDSHKRAQDFTAPAGMRWIDGAVGVVPNQTSVVLVDTSGDTYRVELKGVAICD